MAGEAHAIRAGEGARDNASGFAAGGTEAGAGKPPLDGSRIPIAWQMSHRRVFRCFSGGIWTRGDIGQPAAAVLSPLLRMCITTQLHR